MPSARPSAVVDDEIDERPAFDITPYHEDIFRFFTEGDGHLRVEAFAGSGKTTTILRAIDLAPEDNIWLATFAKRNQEDLAGRLNNPKATAQTIHSLGYQAIRQSEWGYIRTCSPRYAREDDLAMRVTGGLPFGAKRLVGKLCTMARQLIPLAPLAEDGVQQLIDLAIDFDLAPPAGEHLTVQMVARATMQALELARSEKPVKTGIDFADMIYLPMVNDWLTQQFDMAVVDEYQDLSLSQLLFVKRVCYNFARIILVGDRHQAIYTFRGAGGAEVAKLMNELKPVEKPLPISYRCPKSVVRVAEPFAPGFTAAPTAPLGIVDELEIRDLVETAQKGDFILSRSNAPLMPVALALLRADKPATVRGRDIAQGLVTLVKRLATGSAKDSITAFLVKVRHWEEKEINRLMAMKRDDMVANVNDKAETLSVLGHSSTSIAHLLHRLDTLFVDEPTDGVVLSTVHKAKGLEAERVFLLRGTFLRPTPCECGHNHSQVCRRCGCTEFKLDDERRQEERNIYYVAVTRAKAHLTMVL